MARKRQYFIENKMERMVKRISKFTSFKYLRSRRVDIIFQLEQLNCVHIVEAILGHLDLVSLWNVNNVSVAYGNIVNRFVEHFLSVDQRNCFIAFVRFITKKIQ